MAEQQFSLWALIPDFGSLGQTGTSQQLTALAVLTIFIVFAGFLAVVIFQWFKANRRSSALLGILGQTTRDELPGKYREFKQSARAISDEVGNLWNEFHESLVYSDADDRVHNTLDAGHFFNTYTLSRGLTDNRLLAAVPGLLTALGVLGTFAGLQLGLSGLDISSGEVDSLIDGIRVMIQGASIAFASSFWGVLASVVFNAFEKLAERNVRNKIALLQNRLDYLFPRITAEHSLREIQHQTSQSAEALQGMAERIGNKMQEAMIDSAQAMRTGLEETLREILAPALEQIRSNAMNSSEELLTKLTETFLDKVGSQGEAQREALLSASNQMNEAIHGLSQQMEVLTSQQSEHQQRVAGQVRQLMGGVINSFSKQSDAIASREEARHQSSVELTERMETLIGGMEKLAKSFGLLAQTNQKTAVASHRMTQSLGEATTRLDGLGEKIQEAVSTLGTEMTSAVQGIQSVSDAHQDALNRVTSLVETARALHERINEVLVGAQKATEHSNEGLRTVQSYLKQAQDDLKQHVSHLRDSIQQLMDDYSERVKNQTVERMREWNTQTQEFAGSMVNAVNAIQGVVDEIEIRARSD